MAKIDVNSQISIDSMILKGHNHPQTIHFVKSINGEIYTLRGKGSYSTYEITLSELKRGDFYLVEKL